MSCRYTVGEHRKIPLEFLSSLRALEIATVLYKQLPSATIALQVIEQELYKAQWLPVGLTDISTSMFDLVNRPVEDLCSTMMRANSLACIAMFESGRHNIDVKHTNEVVALCSEDSIFVAGIVLCDPTTDNLGMNIRHLVGNVGHAGIVLYGTLLHYSYHVGLSS